MASSQNTSPVPVRPSPLPLAFVCATALLRTSPGILLLSWIPGHRQRKFHVVELGPHQPDNAALLSARGILSFKGTWQGDFPSVIQFLSHLGVVVILTKHTFLFLEDVETAQAICHIQLTCDILFATVLDAGRPHSLLGIGHSGKVLSISICPYALGQYLSHHPTSLYFSQRILQLVGQSPVPRKTVPVE